MTDAADHILATIEAESLGTAFIADVFAVGIAAATEEWLERPEIHSIGSRQRALELKATLHGQPITITIDLLLQAWVGRDRPDTNAGTP